MFGFHGFSENPFSSLSGGVKTGVATLNASGSFNSNGLSLAAGSTLIASGDVTAKGTLVILGNSSLEASCKVRSGTESATLCASGSLTCDGYPLAAGSTLIANGDVTAKGTLVITEGTCGSCVYRSNTNDFGPWIIDSILGSYDDCVSPCYCPPMTGDGTPSSPSCQDQGGVLTWSGTDTAFCTFECKDGGFEASGELVSNISVIHGGFANLPASGSLTSNGSIIIPGNSSLLGVGTVTANNTLYSSVKSSLEASGELTSDGLSLAPGSTLIANGDVTAKGTLALTSDSSLEASGEISSAGSAAKPSSSFLINSGTVSANGTLYRSIKSSLESNAELISNGSIITPGAGLLLGSGTVTANGTLLVPIASTIEASGEISSTTSSEKSSASLLVDSGTVSANGTLALTSDSLLETSGTISSNGTALVPINSSIESTGELTPVGQLTKDGSIIIPGDSLLLNTGTISAKGTLKIVSDASVESSETVSATLKSIAYVPIQSSGTIFANPSVIIPQTSSISATGVLSGISSSVKVSDTTISSSGTTSNNGTLILRSPHSIQGNGSLALDTFNLISEISASISASSTITAQGSQYLQNKATIGNTTKEFVKKTSRPNYKQALPKLSGKDVVLDFPFHEGAGNLHSISSRRQSGNSNMLMWGRVDGRQSLTSNGGSYNNYRVSFDSTSFDFSDGSLIISFKPTDASVGYQFLFNNRGTGNNNNEIDIYSLNTQNKVRIDIYNGTSKQTLDVPNLSFNSWNTLVVTFGSDLKASLNGNDFVTYSSITMPSVNSSTSYILGNSDDRFGMVGSVDHFRLYNKQISDIQAKQLHKNIYKDYSLDYIIPNHYEMTSVTANGRLSSPPSSNISASGQVIGRGTFLLAHLKSSIGGVAEFNPHHFGPLDISSASLQAISTTTANGLLLHELDVVPFNAFITQLDGYNVDISRLKTISTEK